MLAWIAVLGTALALRVSNAGTLGLDDPTRSPFDGDTQYHRLRAEEIAADFPRAPWRDPSLGDGGVDSPWPPLFDEVIAAAALATGAGVTRAAAWVPVALGVLTVPAVGWLACLLLGPEVALGVALLLALSAPHVVYSLLGHSDQHVLELLLTVLALAAYALGLRARGWTSRAGAAASLGAVLALAAWNWQGASLNLLLLAAFVIAWHVACPGDELRARAPAALLAGGSATAAVLLAASIRGLAPSGALSRLSAMSVTGLHVLVAAGCAALGAGLGVARAIRPEAGRARRAAEVVAVMAAIGAPFLLPGLREGIAHATAGLRRGDAWYASIREFMPVVLGGREPLTRELDRALAVYGLAPLLAMAGALALRARWREEPLRRPELLLLATWTALALALAALRWRFALYAAPPLAIYGWLGLRHARSRWLAIPPGGVGATALAAAWVIASAGVPPPLLTPGLASPGVVLAWLRDRRDPTGDATVYAAWRWGHHVRALARRPAVANPFGLEGGTAAFEESLRTFLSTDAGEVERVLRARRAGYLLVEDPRHDVADYQDALPSDAPRLAHVSSSWRTGRTLVETGRYRELVMDRLHRRDGSAGDGLPALGAFRLLRESELPHRPDGRPAFALFGLVPGAWLAVTGAPPGEEIRAEVHVRSNTGRTFTWRTQARAGPDGRARLRVPYATGANGSSEAGAFEVAAGGRSRVAAVSEAAVLGGAEVPVALGVVTERPILGR